MNKRKNKYHIKTFGCQMNTNDSERVSALLNSLGLENVEKPEQADLLIVNTCSVRQSAEDRVFGIIKNWQKLRKKKPELIIAVTGCMPGRDKNGKIKDKIPGVDLWFGIDDLLQFPKWLFGLGLEHTTNNPSPSSSAGRQEGENTPPTPLKRGTKKSSLLEEGREVLGDYLQINPNRENRSQVFISIQTGCDNFCTYCVVPHARGRERNRKLEDILEEIKIAVKNGAKEITLLGQVVNNYKASDKENFSTDNPFVILAATNHSTVILNEVKPACLVDRDLDSSDKPQNDDGIEVKDNFSALLWEINQIPGEFRIHFTAPDPQYFSDEQIEALKLPKQANFLHLPAQSGDNEILKKMNRHYSREEYIELIKKIRQTKPDIALATDIIVGFCGETEEQFQNTVDLYKQCDFDISYHAQYSERTGTTAEKVFKDDVSLEEKKRRWFVLQKLMVDRTFEKNQKYQDQVVRVLIDKYEDGVCFGNSDEMKLCQFLGTGDMIGTFQKIKITQPMTWILKGVDSK